MILEEIKKLLKYCPIINCSDNTIIASSSLWCAKKKLRKLSNKLSFRPNDFAFFFHSQVSTLILCSVYPSQLSTLIKFSLYFTPTEQKRTKLKRGNLHSFFYEASYFIKFWTFPLSQSAARARIPENHEENEWSHELKSEWKEWKICKFDFSSFRALSQQQKIGGEHKNY